ncbi:hypothetical protein SAMN05421819_3682 [Bryocella elongata]|uniref:Cell division protein ZapB n=1 Tax=Bryocella elongata TaxID=863522 RepID=A0A1H6BGD9_9BACT|nr:hypothetical protein [Bryocella elongata]SEG59702.1 hypothetical protein SAMN05421819_3682 [Bryocella elongata]
MAAATISVDEFQALEQKVLLTVELIKKERELRAAAEAKLQQLQHDFAEMVSAHSAAVAEVAELKDKLSASSETAGELDAMKREREGVRQRVEAMLAQMDELL